MPPTIHGTGLFSARESSVTIRPAACATGLRFIVDGTPIPARVAHVTGDVSWVGGGVPPGFPVRNTTLRAGEPARFATTTEHVLSALAGMGIWHADIHLTGVEVPIMDGSAVAFAEAAALLGTGLPTQPLALTRHVEVRDERGAASIVAQPLAPGERPTYTYIIDYGPHSPIKPHTASWDLSPGPYLREFAPARTFSLLPEVEAAQRAGLFRHLTPRDMLVIGTNGLPIDNAWRFPDPDSLSTEPARHKLLDLIGDLALLGAPLHARVVATRSGHALTHQFCRAVLDATGGVRNPETSTPIRA
jgi:UDP-3-O-acyl-N-acetylglucosamine deacetylase